MLIKNRFWGAMGCLILCSSLFACPSGLNIKAALKKGDQQNLLLVAEKLTDCPEWQDSLAMIYHKLSIDYYRQRDINQAIFFTEKALEVRSEIYQNQAHVDLGKSYYNLGAFYKKTGEYLLAKYNLEQSIIVFEKLDIKKRLRNSQYELSSIYTIEGDFQKAETLLKFLINSAGEQDGKLIDFWILLGDTYREQNKYELAKEALSEAINIFQQTKNSISGAQAYLNIGLIHYELKQYQQAIDNYQKAKEAYQLFGVEVELSRTLNNLGLAFLKNGNFQNAKNSFEQALLQAQSMKRIRFVSQSYDNLGELYFSNRQFELSSISLDQALLSLLPLLSKEAGLTDGLKKSIEQSPFKIDLLVYISDKIRALKVLFNQKKDRKYLKETLLYFEIGDYLIDQLRQTHSDQSTKLFWREEVLPFYEKAIGICSILNEVDKAFFYFEKSKSILLLEALLTSNALQSIPESARRKVRYLERQIRLKREVLNQENAQLLKEILDLEGRLEALNKTLTEQYPQLKEQSRDNKVIDLKNFTEAYLNDKNKAMVHYFYGENDVYAMVLNSNEKRIINLGKSSEITELVRGFLQYFEQADRIESQPKAYLQQAVNVFKILVKPLQLEASSHLLIIPSGILTYLPFEALVTEKEGDYGIANAPYLLGHYQVCYGFSATFFDQLQQRSANQFTKSLLGYAPFANRSTSVYPNLNFSQDELSKVSSLVKVDLYTDKAATVACFLKNQADYAVLHLSTHAFSSFSEAQPHIVFADSLLYLADLYQQYIPANLVVLSACQTQIGKLAPGEGVLGLSRGFFYAGTRSVVSSLWNLNAQSSATILAHFYEAMNENIPKYQALHLAKINYLEDENIPSFQKTPYYWASMNYYGDSGQWAIEKSGKLWQYVVGIVLLLGVFLGGKNTYKKYRNYLPH